MYYWTTVEPTTGILSCCLLTYAPLFRAFRAETAQHRTKASRFGGDSGGVLPRPSGERYLKSVSHETLAEGYTYQEAIGESSHI